VSGGSDRFMAKIADFSAAVPKDIYKQTKEERDSATNGKRESFTKAYLRRTQYEMLLVRPVRRSRSHKGARGERGDRGLIALGSVRNLPVTTKEQRGKG